MLFKLFEVSNNFLSFPKIMFNYNKLNVETKLYSLAIIKGL